MDTDRVICVCGSSGVQTEAMLEALLQGYAQSAGGKRFRNRARSNRNKSQITNQPDQSGYLDKALREVTDGWR